MSQQHVINKAQLDKKALNRAFDDALDEIEITYENYLETDRHKPRSLYIHNWLSTCGILNGSVLVLSPYSRSLIILFERLGFTVKGITVTHRVESRDEVQNQIVFSDLPATINLPESYDVIICDDLLEHLVSPLKILLKLKERLNPKGVLILTSKNVSRGSSRLCLLRGRNVYPELVDYMPEDNLHEDYVSHVIPYREYTLREIEDLVLSIGFSIIEKQYIIGKKTIESGYFSTPLFSYLLRKIYFVIQKVFPPLRSHLFVAVKPNSTDV